jgi:HK97 family phage major capsid protein
MSQELETKGLMQAIENIGTDVKESVSKLEAKNQEYVNVKLKEQNEQLEKEIGAAKSAAQKATDEIEALKQKQATQGMGANGTRVKSFGEEAHTRIGGDEWKNKWNNYKDNGKQKGFHVDLEAKAVGNMSAGNLTGSYYAMQEVPGIIAKPYEQFHLRDILPTGTTTSDTIRYTVDNGGEGGAGMVAPGALKPQIDRDLEKKEARVKKIAVYYRLPEEQVEDIPYLQGFLTMIAVEELQATEDTQLLFGDNTGENLNGVYPSATAFTQAAAGVAIVTAANEYDVIRAAQVQLQVARFAPNIAILNPIDYYNMTVRKDTTNNYILQGGGNGLIPQIGGSRVLVQNAMTAGSFLVGDTRTTMIFDRAGTTIRVFEQDQDNAIRNLVTVVVEKRLALVNYRPGAWVKGTFAAAITDLAA